MAIEIANLEAEESDIHDVLAKIGARSSSQPSQPVLTRRQMKPYIIATAVALASAVLIWTAIHPSAPAGVAGEQFEPLLKENGAELIEIGPKYKRPLTVATTWPSRV